MGNAGTLLALLILGFAPNFWVGLAGRVLGGLLNGNIAVIQASSSILILCGTAADGMVDYRRRTCNESKART